MMQTVKCQVEVLATHPASRSSPTITHGEAMPPFTHGEAMPPYKELGVTPTQFLHRERMFRAYRYIRDQWISVKEAAAQVGFDDPFYFSRVFKRIFKRAPSFLRREHPSSQPTPMR
jgi:methylphosphotriester-DNA--protein-cysteine methyltransferase